MKIKFTNHKNIFTCFINSCVVCYRANKFLEIYSQLISYKILPIDKYTVHLL